MANGFASSFEKSFATGAKIGSDAALEGIKEKIKKQQDSADKATKLANIQATAMTLSEKIKTAGGDSKTANLFLDGISDIKDPEIAQKILEAGIGATKSMFDEKDKTKSVFFADTKDGKPSVINALTGETVTDPSQIPGNAQIFKSNRSVEEAIAMAGGATKARKEVELDMNPDIAAATTAATEGEKFSGKPGTIQRATELRKEFQSLDVVKEYQTIRGQVSAMEALVNSTEFDDETKNSNLAKDQGIITLFNKVTDPTSVVRESEYERTPKNLSLANRFKGAFEKWKAGGAGLTQEDRESLVFGAKVIADSRGEQYNEIISNYENLSNKSEVDPELVVSGFGKHKPYISKPSSTEADDFIASLGK